jgi:hypothetical protein
MRLVRILAAFLLLGFVSTPVYAQAIGYAEGGLAGYSGFFGRASDSFHIGAGGEAVAADHVGLGGEFGFFNRLLVGSVNATVHLGGLSARRFSPFVTAGYSRLGILDGEGAFAAFNAGAGFHYWAADRVGFRMEFRDHFRPDDRGTTQYWSVRAGIAFR